MSQPGLQMREGRVCGEIPWEAEVFFLREFPGSFPNTSSQASPYSSDSV